MFCITAVDKNSYLTYKIKNTIANAKLFNSDFGTGIDSFPYLYIASFFEKGLYYNINRYSYGTPLTKSTKTAYKFYKLLGGME